MTRLLCGCYISGGGGGGEGGGGEELPSNKLGN